MQTITFNCQSITPILMHGANGNSAELRPASIKGVLRFWWRAIHGNLPLKELKEREGEIFGSMDQKSSFNIRISKQSLQTENINPLPHKKQRDKGYHKKQAFKANETFNIIFTGQNLNLVSNLFQLSTILGGFGQRSRRGFGSVKIIGSKVLTSHEEVKTLIKTINPKFSYTHQSKKKNEEYPYIRKVKIGKNKNNIDDLLYKISKATSGKCGKHLFQDDRLASPIYVSILKFGENDYRPIITTLNCVSEKYVNFKDMLKRQKAFKEAILDVK